MKIDCRMETGLNKQATEDRILVQNTILAGGDFSASLPRGGVWGIAVADGVGGNQGGAEAAHMAAEGLCEIRLRDVRSREALEVAIREIHKQMVERARRDARCDRMATTLSGLFHTEEKWFLFHIGNTRVYLFEPPYLQQITTDHSVAREMRLAGIPEEEIQRSGKASTITACLGNGEISAAAPLLVREITDFLEAARYVLLTSDGIHDHLAPSVLEQLVASGAPPRELLRQAMEEARQNGSTDDLSMACLTLEA